MRNRLPDAVRAWLQQHDGVITHAAARAFGLSADAIQTLVRRGDWMELQPEVYVATSVPLTWARRARAALAATPGRGALSHAAAAAWLGLAPLRDETRIELLIEDTTLPRLRDQVIVHRTTTLPDCDVKEQRGLLTVTGSRMLVELSAIVEPWALPGWVDRTIGGGRSSRALLHRRALELRNGRKGVGRLVTLTAPGAEGVFRSFLERYAALVYQLGGLPPPRWNHEVRIRGRLLGVVDSWWDRPAVGELDGWSFHSTPAQRRADAARDRRLLRHGIPTFRYGYDDLVERPQMVVDELGEVLDVRSRRLDRAFLGAFLSGTASPLRGALSTRAA